MRRFNSDEKRNQPKITGFKVFKLQSIDNPDETCFVVRVTTEPESIVAKFLRYRFVRMDDVKSVCELLEPTIGTPMEDFGCHPLTEDICSRFPIARWSPRFNTTLSCFN